MGHALFNKLFGHMENEPIIPTRIVPWSNEPVLENRRGDPWGN